MEEQNLLWALYKACPQMEIKKKKLKNQKEIKKWIYKTYLENSIVSSSVWYDIMLHIEEKEELTTIRYSIGKLPIKYIFFPLIQKEKWLQKNCFPTMKEDTIWNILFGIINILDSFRLDCLKKAAPILQQELEIKGESWYFKKENEKIRSKPYLLESIEKMLTDGERSFVFLRYLSATSHSPAGGMESIASFDLEILDRNNNRTIFPIIPEHNISYGDFICKLAEQECVISYIKKHIKEETIYSVKKKHIKSIKKHEIRSGLLFASYLFDCLKIKGKRIEWKPEKKADFYYKFCYQKKDRIILPKDSENAWYGIYEECEFEQMDFSGMLIYASFIRCKFISCNFENVNWGLGFDERNLPLLDCIFCNCFFTVDEKDSNFSIISKRNKIGTLL